MSWMFSSISEATLGHVNQCRSSSEVWFTNERLNSTQRKPELSNSGSFSKLLRKARPRLKSIFLRWRTYLITSTHLDKQSQMMSLFCIYLEDWGTDYKSVVIHLTLRHGDLNLQEVQFTLKSHEMRIDTANSFQVAENYVLTTNLSTNIAYPG